MYNYVLLMYMSLDVYSHKKTDIIYATVGRHDYVDILI